MPSIDDRDSQGAQSNDHPFADRAVSTVIGVVLLVAITVILAAVIGAVVLEIGDEQESAPNVSFETSEERVYQVDDEGSMTLNITVVSLVHGGSDPIAYKNFHVKVDGLEMVMGTDEFDCEDDSCSGVHSDAPGYPVPDLRQTAGTNEQVSFEPGQDYNVITGNKSFSDEPPLKREWVGDYSQFRVLPNSNEGNCFIRFRTSKAAGSGDRTKFSPSSSLGQDQFVYDPLMSGQTVDAIWKASSGGKTQKLFGYTVQRDSETC
jgi:flagellin-like protein